MIRNWSPCNSNFDSSACSPLVATAKVCDEEHLARLIASNPQVTLDLGEETGTSDVEYFGAKVVDLMQPARRDAARMNARFLTENFTSPIRLRHRRQNCSRASNIIDRNVDSVHARARVDQRWIRDSPNYVLFLKQAFVVRVLLLFPPRVAFRWITQRPAHKDQR